MSNPIFNPVKNVQRTMLFVKISCSVLVFLLPSCSAGVPIQFATQQVEYDQPAVQYSIIFIIHGDKDYLFHDTAGNELEADEEALEGAKKAALQNPHAEVFIFHQKKKDYFLFFFPLRDGEFYYYRNGKLIANELYWRDQVISNFDTEAGFYHHFRKMNSPDVLNMFFYFGHEIPEFGGEGYDASYPERAYAVHDLAGGLKKFLHEFNKFDLTVLSTCFSGTPYTVSTLGMFSEFIIASPGNLHLSYFDLNPLEHLEIGLQDGDMNAFANKFAGQSFEKLGKLETEVSIAVYDVDSIQEYLHSVQGVYNQTLINLKEKTGAAPGKAEYFDCADIPSYALPSINTGVNVFYKPARFGKQKYKVIHSGWECRKE